MLSLKFNLMVRATHQKNSCCQQHDVGVELVPPIGIVHMLWLPPLPAFLWAPPRTAACTRLRRLHHYPARAPCLPHLPPAMRISLSNYLIILALLAFYSLR
jgi:hypothetical protein